MKSFQLVKKLGIVPIMQVPGTEYAAPLAHALVNGGLPLAEVMFRNEYAADAIRLMKEACPEMAVGAGTVLSMEQVEKAKAAGADFIVSPGFDKEVIEKALELDMEVLPGCITPTEINEARKLGLDVLKFFPARTAGGVDAMTELSGPYAGTQFVVTGGLTLQDIPHYLACGKVAAIGGDFVTPAEMILRKDWAGIEALCREAIRKALDFSLMHVGVNGESAEEGVKMAERFAEIFDLPFKDGEKSAFAGSIAEFGKVPFPGKVGHIAIGTPSVERAVAHLANRGIGIREEFKNVAPDGTWIAAYLEEEIGGFAVHLLRRS